MKIMDYINGDRRGREAHRIEREAMNDPLLRDALEGLDAVEGVHGRTIEVLRRRIATRSGRRPAGRIMRTAAAAAVLLGLAAGGVYLMLPGRDGDTVPLADAAGESVQVMAAVTPEADTALTAVPQAAKLREAETVVITEHVAAYDFKEADSVEREVVLTDIDESFAFVMPSAPLSVRGRVTDAGGNPIAGAAVLLQGEGESAVTGADGSFILETKAHEGTILVSMAGYEPVKVAAVVDRPLEVALRPNDSKVGDTVANGITGRRAELQIARAAAVQTDESPVVSALHESMAIPDADSLRAVEQFGKYLRHEGLVRSAKRPGGKVVLEFRADEFGTPVDIEVVSSPGRAAQREAIRLLRRSKVSWPPQRPMRVEVDFDTDFER